MGGPEDELEPTRVTVVEEETPAAENDLSDLRHHVEELDVRVLEMDTRLVSTEKRVDTVESRFTVVEDRLRRQEKLLMDIQRETQTERKEHAAQTRALTVTITRQSETAQTKSDLLASKMDKILELLQPKVVLPPVS